jgi:hypothetical protein
MFQGQRAQPPVTIMKSLVTALGFKGNYLLRCLGWLQEACVTSRGQRLSHGCNPPWLSTIISWVPPQKSAEVFGAYDTPGRKDKPHIL